MDSPVAEMTLVSPTDRFELLVPAHWIQHEPGAQLGLVFRAVDPDDRGALLILVEERRGRSLADAATDFRSWLVETGAGAVEARKTVTAHGDPVIVLLVDEPDSLGLGLVHVSDELATLVLYAFPGDVDGGRELATHSLGSFRHGTAE